MIEISSNTATLTGSKASLDKKDQGEDQSCRVPCAVRPATCVVEGHPHEAIEDGRICSLKQWLVEPQGHSGRSGQVVQEEVQYAIIRRMLPDTGQSLYLANKKTRRRPAKGALIYVTSLIKIIIINHIMSIIT